MSEEKKVTEEVAYDETPVSLSEEELANITGGNDGSEYYGSGPQNVYRVYVPSSYLALRSQPVYKFEVEIGKMWNGYRFQSYKEYSGDYVYGYSLDLQKEGWTNRNFLYR